MAVLKATGLQKSYKRRMVVSDVSLEVGTGQIVGCSARMVLARPPPST